LIPLAARWPVGSRSLVGYSFRTDVHAFATGGSTVWRLFFLTVPMIGVIAVAAWYSLGVIAMPVHLHNLDRVTRLHDSDRSAISLNRSRQG
ncbi:MAG: hypothetical protein QOJ59_4126, partial [Thermomicrobiales bacterium]|nr:hypothetical protein [Thermomicrobiales bacterium]